MNLSIHSQSFTENMLLKHFATKIKENTLFAFNQWKGKNL